MTFLLAVVLAATGCGRGDDDDRFGVSSTQAPELACESPAVAQADGWCQEPSDAPTPTGSVQPSGSPVPTKSTAKPPAQNACPTNAKLVPSCGAWLGIWPRTTADGTVTSDLWGNLTSLEQRLGRKFDIASRYYGWGQLPPDGTDDRIRDGGRLVLIDLRARNFSNNTYVQWRDIANGRYDDYLRTVAARLKAYGKPFFFSFNQEPEQELERGTSVAGSAADFVAAYRHLHALFRAQRVDNAVWVWWIMGCMCHQSWYKGLYPGDSYVDWVGYDPYDFNSCNGSRPESPTQAVKPFYDWLTANKLGAGKPWMLAEFGSHGQQQGDFYAGMADTVKQLPKLKAIISFNSNPGGCDTRVTASADNWRGFAKLAKDPYFNQPRPW